MTKKVGIFLFSGTGMTKYVVDKISLELMEKQASVDIYNIEDTDPTKMSISNYDIVGVAYPVHAWNAPEIVINFAKQLPKVKSINSFIVSTSGEYKSINFASSKLLINILCKKGFNVFYDKQLTMPCNFMYKDEESEAKNKIVAVNKKIPQMARDIIIHNTNKLQYNFSARTRAFIGRAEWNGAKLMKLFLTVNKDCNKCGLCVKKCPNRNISLTKNQVYFGWDCGLCARCFYICPKRAIEVRYPFSFFSFDSWYDNNLFSDKIKNK